MRIWKTLLLLGLLFGGILTLTSCRLPLKPIPGPGRNGRFYAYTEDYRERDSPFCLLGKSLTASKGNGSWEIIPAPTAIFPGLPLLLLEQYVICPVVDTLLIPYDLWIRRENRAICASEGVSLVVLNAAGRPLEGVELSFSVCAQSGRRIVYDGVAQDRGAAVFTLKTDASGRVYLPLDFSTCISCRFEGEVWTSEGTEAFDGSLDAAGFSWRPGKGGSSFRKWNQPIPCPFHLEHNFACHRCQARKGWNERQECRACGHPIDIRAVRERQRLLRRDPFFQEARTVTDYAFLTELTGLNREQVESVLGLPVADGRGRTVVIRTKGRTDAAVRQDALPACVRFADGTDPAETLRQFSRSQAGVVLHAWRTDQLPEKVADFDVFWDGSVSRMRASWTGEVAVAVLSELGSPSVRVSRVSFAAGGRRMQGWLSEPVAASATNAPVLAFFGRGRDPAPADMPRPADRTVLSLSVFPEQYDYHHMEWRIREKYNLSQWAVVDGYAIDGIEGGREAYFFHAALSGALRMVEWFVARTGCDRVCCAGVDQGASLALMTAALSERVGQVRGYHPAFVGLMDDLNSWPEFRWHDRSKLMDRARETMPYYELCSFAPRVQCPVEFWLNLRETPIWRCRNSTLAVVRSLRPGSPVAVLVDNSVSTARALQTLVAKP